MKLSVILEAIDNVTKPVRAIAARVRSLSSQLGLGRLASSASAVGKSFGNVAKEATSMAARTAAAFGIVGTALLGLVKSSADAGDAANDTAQRIGIGIEAYQKRAYAAKMSGADEETAAKGLSVLNKQVTEAAKGNKVLAANFKALGISVKDANGKLKPTEQIFDEIADRFKDMPDGAKKSYIAMKLLGVEAGPRLVQTLNNGSAGMKALGDEAERLGKVIGQKAANASADFNDSLDRLLGSLVGLRNSIGAKLLPVLTPLIGQMTDWIVANRELIATKLQDFIDALPDRIAAVRQGALDLYQRLSPLIDAFRSLIDWIGPANAGFGAFAGIIGGKFLLSVAQLTLAFGGLGKSVVATSFSLAKIALAPLISSMTAFVTAMRFGTGATAAFNIALRANPIGLVITAVQALAAVVFILYENWDTIGPWFAKLWDGVKETFSGFVDWVKAGFTDAIIGSFKTIWDFVGPIIDRLKEGFTWATSIANKAGSLLSWGGDKDETSSGSASAGAAAVPVAGAGRVDAGGSMKIEVTDTRTRITRAQPNDPRMDWQTDVGTVMQ